MNIPQDIMNMAKVFTYAQVTDESSAPQLTGIPPHVVILSKIASINEHTSDCSSDVVTQIKTELDNRFVGGDHHQASLVLGQVQTIQEEMRAMLSHINNPSSSNTTTESSNSTAVGSGSEMRQVFYWGGRIHNIPEGFKVPKMTLGALITCWFCGDTRESIPPLRFVHTFDLVEIKSAKVLISQWRTMMKHVRRAADIVGFRIPRNNNMSTSDTVALYSAVKPLFKYKSLRLNHKCRYEGILWKTVHNIVLKNKGKFEDEANQLQTTRP